MTVKDMKNTAILTNLMN